MSGVGTDAGGFYLRVGQAEVQQLQLVGGPQVDVVFVGVVLPFGDVGHREIVRAEGFIHLFAHLEGGKRDAGADSSLHFFALCAIARMHPLQCVPNDVVHSSAPAGMNSGDGAMPLVVQ